MNTLNDKILDYKKSYNKIRIDLDPEEICESIKDFLEVSNQLKALIDKIEDEKKKHLYILEDFHRTYFK